VELGITTVEIGVQSLDDDVLNYNNRGIRSRRLRSQRRDRIILADNCSEVKKAEQAHAEN